MSRQQIQYVLASVFFVLGGWCLVSPSSVMALAITPQYQSDAPIVPLLMRAFGAQAIIAGLFATFSTFRKATFVAYGIGLLPFFLFDYWFFVVEPLLTWIGLLDALGNLVMLVLCYLGWHAVGAETSVKTSRPAAVPICA